MSVIGRFIHNLTPYSRRGDTLFYYLQFIRAHGRLPQKRLSFNDLLFQLKASERIDSALLGFISDKQLVKLFVRSVVGEEFNVPTLSILKNEAEVRNYDFQKNCVVKPTHASGEVIFTGSDGNVNRSKVISWLKYDYYKKTRERNYRNLEKKIIVEPLIFGRSDNLDYKFHCYHGKVRLLQVDTDRHVNHTRAFFKRDFERLPFSIGYPISEVKVSRPENLTRMIEIAECLSSYFPYIRVDMYTDGERFLVGELTNLHGNAHEPFFPLEAEEKFGPMFFT